MNIAEATYLQQKQSLNDAIYHQKPLNQSLPVHIYSFHQSDSNEFANNKEWIRFLELLSLRGTSFLSEYLCDNQILFDKNEHILVKSPSKIIIQPKNKRVNTLGFPISIKTNEVTLLLKYEFINNEQVDLLGFIL